MLKKREGRNHALVRVNECEKGGERFAEKIYRHNLFT